ncbi:unnamed protein product [Porites evermanni]|uniref:PARP catalytic domain-containing protein n=1 Tax=Porites evermanni TaxID=104178 RepID=A0ABN8RUM0_9CNID|nr:unnamed protein product [Porites evermanni]
MQNGEKITLSRKIKVAEEEIFVSISWAPMPSSDMAVHTVTLAPGSSEYQDVASKFRVTGGGMQIQEIERIHNPHLYKQYMVRK